jgi:hypothetical protein
MLCCFGISLSVLPRVNLPVLWGIETQGGGVGPFDPSFIDIDFFAFKKLRLFLSL